MRNMTYSVRLVLQYLAILLVICKFLLEAAYTTCEWYFRDCISTSGSHVMY